MNCALALQLVPDKYCNVGITTHVAILQLQTIETRQKNKEKKKTEHILCINMPNQRIQVLGIEVFGK